MAMNHVLVTSTDAALDIVVVERSGRKRTTSSLHEFPENNQIAGAPNDRTHSSGSRVTLQDGSSPDNNIVHDDGSPDNSITGDLDVALSIKEQTRKNGNAFCENGICNVAGPKFIDERAVETVKSNNISDKVMNNEKITRESIRNNQYHADDDRVGIVVEAATRHFDCRNRLHPERPSRIESIVQALTDQNLMQRCRHINFVSMPQQQHQQNICKLLQPVLLTNEDYIAVHHPGYIQRLTSLENCTSSNRLDREAAQFQSVFLTQNSVAEARRAASALCCLVDCVLSRRDGSVSDEDEDIVNGMYDADYGFAIIRPPGHHAEPGLAGGFCLINNVAVAASFALRRHLTQTSRSDANVVQKVLIVDWDVHHGNGTQSIFWTDPSVLYFSVHVFLTGIFYPGTGRADAVGAGAGLGRTVNVAWSCQGMGDAEYLAVWERLLLPMACEFHPDLVLISAGFDAAAGDIGNCHLTANGFASLTRRLKQTLCQASRTKSSSSSSTSLHPAPMVCALEGGYVNSRLGQCVSAVVEAMLQKIDDNTLVIDDDSLFLSDQSTNSLLDCDIHPVARRNIEQTMESQRPFWNFLSDNG